MFIAGLHVPDTPLVEVVGNAGIVEPEQYAPTGVNVGVTLGFTVIVPVALTDAPQPPVNGMV